VFAARGHPGSFAVLTAGLVAVVGVVAVIAFMDGGGPLDGGGPPLTAAKAAGGEHHAGDHHSGGAAPGPDSGAPPGATVDWLPNEDWVLQHWLPYTERDLWRVLRTGRLELQASLRVGPLARLARRKNMNPRRVLQRLMAPVRREYPSSYRLLYDRARRTFTQRHLMQHMLFHPLHHTKLSKYIVESLGIGWLEIDALRKQGKTFDEIAQLQGIAASTFERGGLNTIRTATQVGIRGGAIPRRQARNYVREVRSVLPKQWSSVSNLHAHPD
jgi:hypothetical protein